MLRPITSWINGFTLSIAAAGPAIAKMSFPAAATGLAPNTGAAMNDAPRSARRCAVDAAVSGWMVEVSMKILPAREVFVPRALVTRESKTASSEIYVRQYLVACEVACCTMVKMISDACTRLSKLLSGSAPASWSAWPLDILRLL